MAVILAESELTITYQPNLLIVAGSKAEMEGEYLHRGLPSSEFERRFELADHVKVAQAELQNGLLTIKQMRIARNANGRSRLTRGAPDARSNA